MDLGRVYVRTITLITHPAQDSIQVIGLDRVGKVATRECRDAAFPANRASVTMSRLATGMNLNNDNANTRNTWHFVSTPTLPTATPSGRPFWRLPRQQRAHSAPGPALKIAAAKGEGPACTRQPARRRLLAARWPAGAVWCVAMLCSRGRAALARHTQIPPANLLE